MPTISPNEAAKRTGRSRRTIMRAIEAREIEASRDNRNQWQIAEDALAQWARNEQPIHTAHAARTSENPVHMQFARLEAEVAGLRERLAASEQANADLRSDRDAWRAMADKLTAPRPWWRRLAS